MAGPQGPQGNAGQTSLLARRDRKVPLDRRDQSDRVARTARRDSWDPLARRDLRVPLATQGRSGPQALPDQRARKGMALRSRAAWDADTVYHANDVVTRNGSAYVARDNSVGIDPQLPGAAWTLLASRGEDGPAGANGTDGTNGANGTNGLNGMDGTNGTDGTNGMNGMDGQSSTPGQGVMLAMSTGSITLTTTTPTAVPNLTLVVPLSSSTAGTIVLDLWRCPNHLRPGESVCVCRHLPVSRRAGDADEPGNGREPKSATGACERPHAERHRELVVLRRG